MKHKILLIATGSILLFGGAMLSVAYGTIPLSDLFIEKLQPAAPPGLQAIGATSTPPGVLEALTHAPPQAQVPKELPLKYSYGPLNNTYTDQKYGFSIRYPDELFVSDTGDGMGLYDTRGGKIFGLKICNPESLCGKWVAQTPARSLKDLEGLQQITLEHKEAVHTYGNQLPEKFIPLKNTMLNLPNGVQILKQSYRIEINDDRGNNVTEQICEECGGTRERYFLFKNQDNYLLLEFIGGDVDLQAKIIQSISYK